MPDQQSLTSPGPLNPQSWPFELVLLYWLRSDRGNANDQAGRDVAFLSTRDTRRDQQQQQQRQLGKKHMRVDMQAPGRQAAQPVELMLASCSYLANIGWTNLLSFYHSLSVHACMHLATASNECACGWSQPSQAKEF